MTDECICMDAYIYIDPACAVHRGMGPGRELFTVRELDPLKTVIEYGLDGQPIRVTEHE